MLRRINMIKSLKIALLSAVATLAVAAAATASPTNRWHVSGATAYVSSSREGTSVGDSFVLGYLIGSGFQGGRGDCALLDQGSYYDSGPRGIYLYGDLTSGAGCGTTYNTVGRWHGGTRCMWAQVVDQTTPDNTTRFATMANDGQTSTGTPCASKPAGDGGLWASTLFEPDTSEGGPPSEVNNGAVISEACTDGTVYANYDPADDSVHDWSGTEAVGRGTPGYAGSATPIAGFMSRYRTANVKEVLIKDTTRPGVGTAWGFMRATCVTGLKLKYPLVTSESQSVDGISQTTATLHGAVLPNTTSSSALYKFEYGTTASYGAQSTPTTLAGDLVDHAVSAALTGLSPGTTYHYRLVATTGASPSCADTTSCGADRTFTTAAVPVNTSAPSVQQAASRPLAGVPQASSAGTWTNSPSSYSYQWSSCFSGTCSAIAGATSSGYTPRPEDAGATLKVTVTATNGSGSSAPATSAASEPVVALETASAADDSSVSPVRDRSSGRVDVFARATSSTLWQAYFSGTGNSAWTWYRTDDGPNPAPVTLASPPAYVRDPISGRQDVFAAGSDGALWQAYWSGAGATRWYWYKVTDGTLDGPSIAGAASVIRNPLTGRIDVFVRGQDGGLYQAYWSGAGATRWYWFKLTNGSNPAPVTLGSAPAATYDPNTGRMDVFFRSSTNVLWQAHYPAGSTRWYWYEVTDGANVAPAVRSTPAVARDPATGRIDVFARGASGQLWQAHFSAATNGQWLWYQTADPVHGNPTVESSPSLTRFASNDRIDVFVRGTDNALWQAHYSGTAGSQWTWYKIDDGTSLGPALAGAPSVIHDMTSDRFDVYVRGADNALWQGYYAGIGATRWYWYQLTNASNVGPALE